MGQQSEEKGWGTEAGRELETVKGALPNTHLGLQSPLLIQNQVTVVRVYNGSLG